MKGCTELWEKRKDLQFIILKTEEKAKKSGMQKNRWRKKRMRRRRRHSKEIGRG